MSDRQQFERVSWFHGRIKAGRFPNSGHLVEEFEIAQVSETIAIPANLPDIKEDPQTFRHHAERHNQPGVLQFSPTISPWIAEQSWHPEQKADTGPDGALRLEFPVADFRELVRTVLSHGAEVSVVEPEALKDLVGREIDRMAKNYLLG